MTGAGRLRRTASAVLVWALLVALAGVVLVRQGDDASRPTAAPPTAPSPGTSTTIAPPTVTTSAPASTPAATTPPTAVAPARVGTEPTDGAAPSEAAAPAPATTPTTSAGVVTAPAVAASCRPDLALEASPDAPYSFLCTMGSTPISWPDNAIRLYPSNLTAPQTAALPIALAQWQSQAHFDVTLVSSETDANVVLTSAALSNNEDGYTSMHYVCAASCAYDHSDVRLTSTAQLTKTSWITTILHELGHVAGLNHVSRHSEVMYPQIDSSSPASYGAGDLAGFRALESVRSA